MSSSDHIHPEQLRMFIPAKELFVQDDPETGKPDPSAPIQSGDYLPGVIRPFKNYESMWKTKMARVNDANTVTREGSHITSVSSFRDDVEARGVIKPVKLAYGDDLVRAQSQIDPQVVRTPSLPHVSRMDAQYIVDGHHRIAATHDIDPDREVPVLYQQSAFAQDQALEKQASRGGKRPTKIPMVNRVLARFR